VLLPCALHCNSALRYDGSLTCTGDVHEFRLCFNRRLAAANAAGHINLQLRLPKTPFGFRTLQAGRIPSQPAITPPQLAPLRNSKRQLSSNMASGRRQLAALLLIVALAQSASATYVGYALGCTGDTTINCGPNMLGSVTLTTVKSCARVSVGCYSGYSGSTCGGKDGSCPKCVDNGNSITLTCSSSNCPASNPSELP
jgi:hypothetical protein